MCGIKRKSESKIGERIASTESNRRRPRGTMAVWEKRAVRYGGEDAGLRREMGARAGRIESWCDPLDGSSRWWLWNWGKEGKCSSSAGVGGVGMARHGLLEALSFCPPPATQSLRSGLGRAQRGQRAPQGFSAAAALQQGAPASPASPNCCEHACGSPVPLQRTASQAQLDIDAPRRIKNYKLDAFIRRRNRNPLLRNIPPQWPARALQPRREQIGSIAAHAMPDLLPNSLGCQVNTHKQPDIANGSK